MNSATESLTIQYRLNLPSVLNAISPALSALHASRLAALHPETTALLYPSHCPKCGTYRFDGDHPTQLVGPSTRKKRKRTVSSRPNTLQRRCHRCGFAIDARAGPAINRSSVLIESLGDSPSIGPVTTASRSREIGQAPPGADVSDLGATTLRAPAPLSSGRPSHTKSGHPKASLRDILSRERQREEGAKAHKKKKEGHDGLAAFLMEL